MNATTPAASKVADVNPTRPTLHQENGNRPVKKRKITIQESPTGLRRITRGMKSQTTDAARKAVFNTSELLESILVYLPSKTLFGVLRVSKQFQETITTSIAIQEKMFLRIRNKPQDDWLLKPKRNPSDIGFDPRFVVHSNGEPPSPGCSMWTPVHLNPLLEVPQTHLYSSCARRAFGNGWSRGFGDRVRLAIDKPLSLSILEGKGPTILNTYISDPPIKFVSVSYSYLLHGCHLRVARWMIGGRQSIATIRDLICATWEGDGRVYIDIPESPGTDHKRAPDMHSSISNPRQVIEHYEMQLEPRADLEQGINELSFILDGAIVPTDAERIAVKPEQDMHAV